MMARIYGSPEVLAQMSNNLERAIQDIERAADALNSAYRAAGGEWKDQKYNQLGDVIDHVTKSMKSPIPDIGSAIRKIKEMERELSEYMDG